jgi:hypothetical protein
MPGSCLDTEATGSIDIRLLPVDIPIDFFSKTRYRFDTALFAERNYSYYETMPTIQIYFPSAALDYYAVFVYQERGSYKRGTGIDSNAYFLGA